MEHKMTDREILEKYYIKTVIACQGCGREIQIGKICNCQKIYNEEN